MANQNALHDENKWPAMIAHTGTAGTAETIRLIADTSGNLMVNLAAGETINVGTLNVGTIDKVSEVTNGTIRVTDGTVKVTTPGTITSGSIAVVAGTGVVTSGSIAVTDGTVKVTTPGTITSGSISVIAGTIGSGTINAGTFRSDARPTQNILSFATSVSIAGSAYGTIIGSASVGAGTYMYVNDLSLLNQVGTVTCAIGFGTWNQGTATLFRGKLGAREGVQKSFPQAVNAGMTNQDLTIWTDGTTTVDVSVSYFISS